MTKDEALKLALKALEELIVAERTSVDIDRGEAAITAIKQARALDKMAENARELGLDYEPADGTQVSKVWWDGEKLMAKPIPLEDFYQPVQPVQEPFGYLEIEDIESHSEYPHNCRSVSLWHEGGEGMVAIYTTPPAAQRQWVGLTDEEVRKINQEVWGYVSADHTRMRGYAQAIEAKLKERTMDEINYSFKPTGQLSVSNFKPNYNISFHNNGQEVGKLDFNGPKMVFTGDAEGSAKVFIDWIARSFAARLEEERKAEREACAKVADHYSMHDQDTPADIAEAIRARGNT